MKKLPKVRFTTKEMARVTETLKGASVASRFLAGDPSLSEEEIVIDDPLAFLTGLGTVCAQHFAGKLGEKRRGRK